MMFRTNKNRSGFTLIEILLSLTIFSVIALTLYSTFATGMQLARRSENAAKIYREIRWSLERMKTDLQNTVDYDFRRSYPDRRVFTGKPDRVSFLIATDQGLKRVTYSLKAPEQNVIYQAIMGRHHSRNISQYTNYREQRNIYLLVREEQSFVDSLQEEEARNVQSDIVSTSLLEGGLEFSYPFLEGAGDNPRIVWKGAWEERYLPAAVHVKMRFINYENKEVPIIVEQDIFVPTGFGGEENSGGNP